MDKRYDPPPLSEEGKGSNSGKRHFNFTVYENELDPQEEPTVWSIQEKVTATEVHR